MSNKDEALRAKDLAEDFMRNRNFTTARRIAMKAQKMDASLEDVVSRMIKVCDVHCAAMEKSGDESDWYKILQVEQNADDNTIKKQYKKLALYLHPDKTQAPGAENAFKTIGEAQRVLLDKDQRRLHDLRRKTVKKPAPPAYSVQPQQAPTTGSFTQRAPAASTFQAPTTGSFAQRTPAASTFQAPTTVFFAQRAPAASTFHAPTMGSFTQRAPSPSCRPQQAPAPGLFTQRVSQTTWKRPENQEKRQTQSTEFGGGSRFWTSCAFCNTKSEYSWECINKQVTCVACGRQYVAFRETFPGPPVQATFPFSQQCKVPNQEAGKAAEKQPEISAKVSSSKEGSRAKSFGISAENGNGKRKRKMLVESSDGSCSDSSIECKEVPAGKQDSGTAGGQHARRSVRSKQQILYNENKDDDNKEEDAESAEESNFQRMSHENHLFSETLPNGIHRTKKIKADQVGRSRDSSSGSASDAVIFECADADFSNFEKLREVTSFKPDQTWAMYDDMDRMPRFYAIIRKVVREPFMVKIQWLEAKPDDLKAVQWVHKKLPISVGKYRLGGEEETTEAPSFSHLIHSSKGSRHNIIVVYPRIGEIWALFKKWDITWSFGRKRSSHEHEYEYEFVEILSEYSEGVAIKVAYLRKVKGFASVFCRIAPGAGSDTFQIPPDEMLRFSHSIPSTKLTGKERNGVPAGSFDLDTAALPQKIEEYEAVPIIREAAKSNQALHRSHQPSSDPDCILIPSFDFHDFSAERLEGKFENGQIWSLNSKEDGLPKCYVKIQKVVWKPMFLLQIIRLELDSLPENVTQWQDNKMPVSCGNFRLKDGRAETLTKVTGFSHQIKAQQRYGENKYTVLPKTGEVWAMYKNWSETMKAASLKRCDYEVVEVLDDNESYIEVLMLEKVPGLISVFKEKVEGGKDVKKVIPRCELLRFSHYVAAFRLTGEKDGAFRGCIELDSSALPLRKS